MQQVVLYAKGVDKRKTTTTAGSRLLEENHTQPRLRIVKQALRVLSYYSTPPRKSLILKKNGGPGGTN
jgi:hypothetical protein